MSIAERVMPTNNNLLVQRVKAEEKMASGLFVPQSSTIQNKVKILAVGPGRYALDGSRIPLDLEPGMTAVLMQWQGTEFALDGEQYLITPDETVLAVLRD